MPLRKLGQLARSHGALRPGKGVASGVAALGLALLCFLGVLAFHFPQQLTTPQLRANYDVGVLRQVMFWSLVLAGAVSLHNLLRNRSRWLAASAFGLIALTLLLGGHRVPVGALNDGSDYIGMDWSSSTCSGRRWSSSSSRGCSRCARRSRSSGPSGRPISSTSWSTTWRSVSSCWR